jgi:hypothetical protein
MTDAVSGSTRGHLTLQQSATGGDGGRGSAGGRGGDASSSLNAINAGGGSLTAWIYATGGNGAETDTAGSAGGDATVSATAVDATGAGVDVKAYATGGAALGDHAMGGTASLGPVFASSDFGGSVSVMGTAQAGRGISGRSVELVDAVGGSTSGDLFLYQRAEGGHARVGTAGAATSRLTHTGASTSLSIQSQAFGGQCAFTDPDCTSDGADAIASASAVNTAGSVSIPTYARRGSGGDDTQGRSGGNATGTAIGEAIGDYAVTVQDSSHGGYGGEADPYVGGLGGPGGDASSTAIATGGGASRVEAVAQATGGGPGIVSAGVPISASGSARATATATGLFEAEARAKASSANRTREAVATAFGGGAVPTVVARASASAPYALTSLETVAGIASDATFPTFGYSRPPGPQGFAAGLAMPNEDRVDLFLEGNPELTDTVTAGFDALALGAFGFSGVSEDFEGALQFVLAEAPADPLLLGLANPYFKGDGFSTLEFQVLVGGELQIDESFPDLAAALLFFDDSILSIALAGALDVELLIRPTTDSFDDRFGFDFALLAVPEPSTGGLLVFGIVIVGICRRGRKNDRIGFA